MSNCVDVGRLAGADRFAEFAEPGCIRGVHGALRRPIQQRRPFQYLARQILQASFELGGKLLLPAAEGVGPGLDRVFVDRVFVEGANSPPTVVVDVHHWRFVPLRLTELPPFQGRGNNVVSVLKNIRFHLQVVAHHAFDHVAAAIHERLQILNNGGRKSP